MTILVVGDRPSRYNKHPNEAFIGAKCYPRLLSWLEALGITSYRLINSHTPYCMEIIEREYSIDPSSPIIALGLTAQKRLSQAGVPYLALPHPSGLNRQVNDKDYIQKRLKAVKSQIEAFGKKQ